jgi:hypothetical protein
MKPLRLSLRRLAAALICDRSAVLRRIGVTSLTAVLRSLLGSSAERFIFGLLSRARVPDNAGWDGFVKRW